MPKSRMARISTTLLDQIKQISEAHKVSQIQASDHAARQLRVSKKKLVPKSKKGQSDNLGFILVAFFIMALAVVPTYWVLSAVNDEAQINDAFDNKGGEILNTQTNEFAGIFDGLTVMVLIVLFLALIGSAFLVDTQPFFFVISLVIFIFVALLAAIFANIWDDLTTNPSFATLAQDLPITNFVFQNLLIVMIMMGFTTFIVLYGKLRSN